MRFLSYLGTFAGVRVLLTGASGFLGSHLLDRLDGHDVVALTPAPLPTGPPRPWVSELCADLTDEAALADGLEGCDAVVHRAAVSTQAAAAADPVRCVEVNTAATARLAHLAARAGVARFVFTSTALVYGQPPSVPIEEDTPACPSGMYAVSKFAAELCLAELFAEPLVLRVFNVYGPRQSGTLVPALVERVLSGAPVQLQGDGSQVRSFLYVDDAVEAMVSALESDLRAVFNLACAPHTILEVATAVAAAFGVAPAVLLADGVAATVAAAPGHSSPA